MGLGMVPENISVGVASPELGSTSGHVTGGQAVKLALPGLK